MVKYSVLLAAALFAGLAFSGSVATAGGRQGCDKCRPTTTQHVKTIRPTSSVTRYHDVNVSKHVARIHRVVNVVRIQPIVRIHDVTRVHHHTIYVPKFVYARVTQRLAPIRQVTHSVIHTYDCSCGGAGGNGY